MRNANEIQARIDATAVELDQLNQRIGRLSHLVKEGGDGWLRALEDLATAYRRRNEVRIQMENLHWVITPALSVPGLPSGSHNHTLV